VPISSNWPSLEQQPVHLQSHQRLALLGMVEASSSFSQKPPLCLPHYQTPGCAKPTQPCLGSSKAAVGGRSVTPSNDSEASTLPLKPCTLAGMASKTTSTIVPKRVAHVPSLQSTTLQRPVIPTEFGAKVPTNIRQRYLNLFIDECLKFCSSSQEAFDKVCTHLCTHPCFSGVMFAAGNELSCLCAGAALYRRLKEYLMTEEQLKENGYPMPHPEKAGRAVLYTAEEKKVTDCKFCCLFPSAGFAGHSRSLPGGWETHYSCCSGAVGSPGCQVAKQHVHDGRKESLDGFVKTFEKLPTTDGYPGIYALDCEMCYTKQGLELTRVTVINSELKVVYDTFVKPDSKVVDYNTRFSGVTEEDLENTSITLRDVQAVLLNMFSADTILIGHSLESDLFALKLIHGTVVDTAIVFPHRLGLPYKRALRTLMADYLKRIIQDNVEGHDSSEDARACMELMVWKIKEDAKVKR
uniref:RNA exonuclease 1 homolog n=1 Tax=Zonotrichia albicollis TaxID=44394 RepID=A0A8D2NH66_ZONAL